MGRPALWLALGVAATSAAVIAFLAVGTLVHPALAVLSGVILALAALRTTSTRAGHDSDQQGPSPGRLLVRFLASLAVASAIVVVPIVAFGVATILFILGPGSGSGCGDEGPPLHVPLTGLVVAFVTGSLLKRWLWAPRPPAASIDEASEQAGRSWIPFPRLTLGKAMKLIAVLAIGFAVLHAATRRPGQGYSYDFHEMMSEFCAAEAALFDGRSRDCRRLSAEGVPWNDPGERSGLLRNGPYPWDQSLNRSWNEQAEVWRRAADQARRMARWHASR